MERHVPFQVQLTAEQHRRIRRLAGARGASMGSIIRESIATYLAGIPVEEDPAFGVAGLIVDDGPEPHGDVAREHDAYLADALDGEASGRSAGPREPA